MTRSVSPGRSFFATTRRVILLTALIMGSIGAVAHAQTAAPTPIVLFHDDFVTRANRWTLSALGDPDSISYSEPDSTLDFALTTPNALIASTPDTDLAPDTFALDLHADWHGSSPNARVGAILAAYSDNDFIAVTVTRAGLVQIGSWQQKVWQDLVTPEPTTGIALSALALHVEVNAVDSVTLARQVSVTVNQIPAQTATLPDYRSGTFGIVAANGSSGSSLLSVHDFQISKASSP